jgi:hypothetical protein
VTLVILVLRVTLAILAPRVTLAILDPLDQLALKAILVTLDQLDLLEQTQPCLALRVILVTLDRLAHRVFRVRLD